MAMQTQADLFENTRSSVLPAGFRYQAEFIDQVEERRLVQELQRLDFAPFEFHGFAGKRRVLSFGWRYDFNTGGLEKTKDIPAFLIKVRDAAALFSGLHPLRLQQALLIEYPQGAPIGWHKDRFTFGEVIGISLLSPCTLRFRKRIGAQWLRSSIVLQPRSAYLLRGPSRTEWEHSIPAVASLRYSITFRTMGDV
jgi:alkylated DNA repair dioxygenase AlkB